MGFLSPQVSHLKMMTTHQRLPLPHGLILGHSAFLPSHALEEQSPPQLFILPPSGVRLPLESLKRRSSRSPESPPGSTSVPGSLPFLYAPLVLTKPLFLRWAPLPWLSSYLPSHALHLGLGTHPCPLNSSVSSLPGSSSSQASTNPKALSPDQVYLLYLMEKPGKH